MKCSRLNCKKPASAQALFHIYPLGFPMSQPLDGTAPLYACAEHATAETAQALLGDNPVGRKQIEAALEANGLHNRADWARSYIEWKPIMVEMDPNDEVMPKSGMKVSEALKSARIWWDGGGKVHMSRRLREASNVEEIGRRVVASSGKSPGFVVEGDKQTVIRSGILQGKSWYQLDPREQLQIVKTWHHYFVVCPMEGMALSAKPGVN